MNKWQWIFDSANIQATCFFSLNFAHINKTETFVPQVCPFSYMYVYFSYLALFVTMNSTVLFASLNKSDHFN